MAECEWKCRGIVRGSISGYTSRPAYPGRPAGTKALGITSGGSGDCRSGGTTFYQPVPEAANEYNVTVY